MIYKPMLEKLGVISREVIETLDLSLDEGTPVYVGRSNIAHMAKEHSDEYYQYFDKIPLILDSPDYVRLDEDDGSIEYVKSFGHYVKLAVRVSNSGLLYARSLYRVHAKTVKWLVDVGEFKPIKPID